MAQKRQEGQDKNEAGTARHRVLIFRLYPLQLGDKIFFQDGPRRGDWQVIEVGPRKLRLKCPVSFKELECDHLYTFVEERPNEPWPHGH